MEWARLLHERKNTKGARKRLVDAFLTDGIGAGEGIRTLDPNLGKVVLYP
jgi:hypothetical protein